MLWGTGTNWEGLGMSEALEQTGRDWRSWTGADPRGLWLLLPPPRRPSRRRSRGCRQAARSHLPAPAERVRRVRRRGPPAPGGRLERRNPPASAGGSGDSLGRSPPVPPDSRGLPGVSHAEQRAAAKPPCMAMEGGKGSNPPVYHPTPEQAASSS